jgi:hypothetical protein
VTTQRAARGPRVAALSPGGQDHETRTRTRADDGRLIWQGYAADQPPGAAWDDTIQGWIANGEGDEQVSDEKHLDLDVERIDQLGRRVIALIQECANENYVGIATQQQGDAEILAALAQSIGCILEAIKCPDCRQQKGEATVNYLDGIVEDIVGNPDQPAIPAHVH